MTGKMNVIMSGMVAVTDALSGIHGCRRVDVLYVVATIIVAVLS